MPAYDAAIKVREMVCARQWEPAKKLLEEELGRNESAAVLNDLALVCAALGEDKQMLQWIEKACQKPDADIRVRVNRYYLSELAKLDRSRGENALESIVEIRRGDHGWKPKLSIIIPTYDRCQIIKDAITSVLNQKFQDWELIIVNDGGEREMVKTVEQLWDQRFVYAYARHSGIPGARNVGLGLARGELIGFLDDDDIIYPEHYQRVVGHMDKHPEIKVLSTDLKHVWLAPTGAVVGEKINEAGPYHPSRLRSNYLRNFMSFIIRGECLEKVPGFMNGLVGSDDWEFLIALSNHFKIDYLPGVAGEWRTRIGFEQFGKRSIMKKGKVNNLVIYYHGMSPFFSFSPAQVKLTGRFFSVLSGLLGRCPQLIDGLDFARLFFTQGPAFFYRMGRKLEKENLNQWARACYLASVKLAPYKTKAWERLIKSWWRAPA